MKRRSGFRAIVRMAPPLHVPGPGLVRPHMSYGSQRANMAMGGAAVIIEVALAIVVVVVVTILITVVVVVLLSS